MTVHERNRSMRSGVAKLTNPLVAGLLKSTRQSKRHFLLRNSNHGKQPTKARYVESQVSERPGCDRTTAGALAESTRTGRQVVPSWSRSVGGCQESCLGSDQAGGSDVFGFNSGHHRRSDTGSEPDRANAG